MTTGGWITMITSWVAILSVFTYCIFRTIRGPKQNK